MWFTYIIESANGQLYTGITTDIERRWLEHTQGKSGARFFRSSPPKQLRWLEPHSNRSEASKREAAIKRLSRTEKLQMLQQTSPLPLPDLAPKSPP